MNHQPSIAQAGTPHVSKIWSNIFEPVTIPRGECQTIRTTYNIFKTPPAEPDSCTEFRTPTTQFFTSWIPSNLFNAVQPLRNDYRLRPKVQKCLNFITAPGSAIPPDLRLPITIHLYLARQKSLRIDDTQLSAYFKAVYDITLSLESISNIGDRIFDLDAETLRQRHAPKCIQELSNRVFDFDLGRLMHLPSQYPIRDLILFMDSVWLSLEPSAQEASVNEWNAYAESSRGVEGGRGNWTVDKGWADTSHETVSEGHQRTSGVSKDHHDYLEKWKMALNGKTVLRRTRPAKITVTFGEGSILGK